MIGKKIKQLREKQALTMRQLAERVECTPSLISQLERGKADPSISTLKKIAKALDVNIVDFFLAETDENEVVTRVPDRVDMNLRGWDAKVQSLIAHVGKRSMQPFYAVIRPGGGSHGMYAHEGEEFGIVLQGELELVLNDKVHVVRENESFYFSSQIPHDWANRGKKDVVVVWVMTPPTF